MSYTKKVSELPNSALYSSKEIQAARLIDDMKQIRHLNAQILEKMKNLLYRKKLDHYDYGHVINLLNVNDLKAKQIEEDLDELLDTRSLSTFDIKI